MPGMRVCLGVGGVLLVLVSCASSDSTTGSTADAGDAGGTGGGGTIDGGSVSACKVAENSGNALPPCTEKAPAGAFDAVPKWHWNVPVPEAQADTYGSLTTPLVGNLTDDNQDGAIDLCDTPDIVVVVQAGKQIERRGRMHLLAGDSGFELLAFDGWVDSYVTPALGDIDGDGLPEVVTATPDQRPVAYEHDGTIKWIGEPLSYRTTHLECASVALHDLEGDGSVEIILALNVLDAQGQVRWARPSIAPSIVCTTQAAADLDGDGRLEVIFGGTAYRPDGSTYYEVAGVGAGHPHVANLDGDPEPEVLITNRKGMTLLNHDGSVIYQNERPISGSGFHCLEKAAVIQDFDGDGVAEAAFGSCAKFGVLEIQGPKPAAVWQQPIDDISGVASATGFDFLGDGTAEAIYADERSMFAFDGKSGEQLMKEDRESGTIIEYPVVADVDNDGSAEIVVVANYLTPLGDPNDPRSYWPAVIVLEDLQDRWIPARRIWNQHAYYVTNVREDGTIPAQPKPSWLGLNTFRANSQLANGSICNPPK